MLRAGDYVSIYQVINHLVNHHGLDKQEHYGQHVLYPNFYAYLSCHSNYFLKDNKSDYIVEFKHVKHMNVSDKRMLEKRARKMKRMEELGLKRQMYFVEQR